MIVDLAGWEPVDFPPTCKKCGLVLIPGTDRCADCEGLENEIPALKSLLKEAGEALELCIPEIYLSREPEYSRAKEVLAKIKEKVR